MQGRKGELDGGLKFFAVNAAWKVNDGGAL
jgi:hypothetical protein